MGGTNHRNKPFVRKYRSRNNRYSVCLIISVSPPPTLAPDGNGPGQRPEGPVIPPPPEPAKPFRTKIRSIHFPNGMVGTPYKHKEALLDSKKPSTIQPELLSVGLNKADSGLSVALTGDAISIEGNPKEKGPVRIWIEYKIGGDKILREEFPEITIFPDPKSLWRNLPHDPDAPYQRDDEEKRSQFGISGKSLIAASKRGRSHAHDGRFRDDAFDFGWLPETGWLIVAVSDGAGSAEYSRKGSQIACETFVADLSRKLGSAETNDKLASISTPGGQEMALERLLLETAFHGWKNIQSEAESMNTPFKQYSATFLGYIAKKMGEEWLIVSVGIGDGTIGLIDSDGQLHLMNEPDGGEYVGQTRFLTTPSIWQDGQKRTFSVRVHDFKFLCSMTDGVSDPKFETDNNLKNPDKWNELWDDLNHTSDSPVHFEKRDASIEDELLSWLDFWSKGNHDDRTITILF